jgi:hypothetical protein
MLVCNVVDDAAIEQALGIAHGLIRRRDALPVLWHQKADKIPALEAGLVRLEVVPVAMWGSQLRWPMQHLRAAEKQYIQAQLLTRQAKQHGGALLIADRLLALDEKLRKHLAQVKAWPSQMWQQ